MNDHQPHVLPASILLVHNSDGVVIQIQGRFNFEMHGRFREALRDIFSENTDSKAIVIDMKKTEHIDSSGLGMLLLLRHEANVRGQEVVIEVVHPHLRRILKTASFQRLFKILP